MWEAGSFFLAYYAFLTVVIILTIFPIAMLYDNIMAILLYSSVNSMFLSMHSIHLYNSSKELDRSKGYKMLFGTMRFSSTWKQVLNFCFRWIYPIVVYFIVWLPHIIYRITENYQKYFMNIFIVFFVLCCAFALDLIIIFTLLSNNNVVETSEINNNNDDNDNLIKTKS